MGGEDSPSFTDGQAPTRLYSYGCRRFFGRVIPEAFRSNAVETQSGSEGRAARQKAAAAAAAIGALLGCETELLATSAKASAEPAAAAGGVGVGESNGQTAQTSSGHGDA